MTLPLYSQLHGSSEEIQKRIFESTLSRVKDLEDQTLILNRPLETVGGDFYWFGRSNKELVISLGDAIGHGDPAAFISLIAHQALTSGYYDLWAEDPLQLLHYVDKKITENLISLKDSPWPPCVDLGVISINLYTGEMIFSGASIDLYIKRASGPLTILRGASKGIGGSQHGMEPKAVRRYSVNLEPGDTIFMHSDGLVDQLSPQRGKMKRWRIKYLINQHFDKTLDTVSHTLKSNIDNWQGKGDQTDDIMCVGFRYYPLPHIFNPTTFQMS